jgi:predicted PurR-regulated permease PerM
MKDIRPDLAKNTLGVLSLVAMIGASLWVLRPFLGGMIWATMVVVATWPALLWIQARLWQRRSLAVMVMVLLLVLFFLLPLTMAVGTIAANADVLVGWSKSLISHGLPQLPGWVEQLPFVGPKLTAIWDDVLAAGVAGLEAKLAPHAREVTGWLVTQAGVAGALTLQILLTVFIAGIMYAQGETAAAKVRRLGHRLGGPRGEDAVVLAGKAIRGVALGVGVTAIVQAVAAGIGLAIAGVPFAALLTAVIFMLCIVQLGPTLVLAPAVIWVFWNDSTGWGVFLLVWTLIVGFMDNFIRPVLIRRGADLPLLLIFAGVIGGLLGFGLVGIFVGPVVLAVSYALIDAWIDSAPESPQGDIADATQGARHRLPPMEPGG